MTDRRRGRWCGGRAARWVLRRLPAVFVGLHGLIEAGIWLRGGLRCCRRRRGRLSRLLPLRAASCLGQRGQDGIMHRVKNLPFGEKFNLCLCRVNVHIHGLYGHINFQHAGREAAHHDLVAVRLLHGGRKEPGFDKAIVHEKALPAAVAAGSSGLCDKAAHVQLFPAAVHREHVVCKLAAVDGVNCSHAVTLAVGVQLLLAVLDEPE